MNHFSGIFQPACQVVLFFADEIEIFVIKRSLFPINLIDWKNVVVVKPPAVQFPECQHPSGPAIAVPKRMDGFKTIMNNSGSDYRWQLMRLFVPPFQKLAHQTAHLRRRRRQMAAHPHLKSTVPARLPLIHDAGGNKGMQLKKILMNDCFFIRVFFNVAQPGEIIQNFPCRPFRRRRDRLPLSQ